MENHSPTLVLAGALSTVCAVGLVDRLLGAGISLSYMYVFPVGVTIWYLGRKASALTVLLSMVFELDIGNSPTEVVLWNGLVQFTSLLMVIYILDGLHRYIECEKKLGRLDPVTGIYNQRAFAEHLQYCLDIAAREEKPVSLAYIDLDDFKSVNDRYGHGEGDRLLRLVAGTLRESIRRVDFVARFGGDEFAVLMLGASRSGAENIIEKLRHSLRKAFDIEQSNVTCSIGCVTFHGVLPSTELAIKVADSMMYKVKNQGKDGVAFQVFDLLSVNSLQQQQAFCDANLNRACGETFRAQSVPHWHLTATGSGFLSRYKHPAPGQWHCHNNL